MIRESVRGGPDPQTAVLERKTMIPPSPEGAVGIGRLIERARRSEAPLVSVVAPAGYGKSTLLAGWANVDDRATAWVRLDRSDATPEAMLAAVAAAAASLSVAADEEFEPGAPRRRVQALAAALAAAPDDFVLFIDEVHHAASEESQHALEILLSQVPTGSQVVVAGRSETAIVARLRATRDVYEVGVADLALDRSGARAIFERTGAGALTNRELDAVVGRCEGWPVGLHLAALIARDGGDATTLTGDDRFVADYLARECLHRLSGEMQAFLRRSAVLATMSPAACNAVLGIDDARARLHSAEADGLFLVSMDRTRGLWRFHALFREYLLTELERIEGSEVVAQLHLRAADWHDDNGQPVIALEHLLEGGALDIAVERVGDLALAVYGQGQAATVRRWLDALGDDRVRMQPALLVTVTWLAVLFGDVPGGIRWASLLGDFDAATLPDDARVPFESARAMVRSAMCAEGLDRAVEHAAFALENEPSSSVWRDQALHLWGVACLLRGDENAAAAAFDEAVLVAEAMGNPDSVILCEPELALLAAKRGDWERARSHSLRAVTVIEASRMDRYPTTALAAAVAALVAAHDEDVDGAERWLAKGMLARVGCTLLLPYVSTRVRLTLAEAHVALGDRAGARHLLREIDELLQRRPHVGALSAQIEHLRTSLDQQPGRGGSVPLTPAELRLLPYLQTHLTIAEIGSRLFISRNTVSSELGSIYRKLGVTSRGAAVDRAAHLGLLGG